MLDPVAADEGDMSGSIAQGTRPRPRLSSGGGSCYVPLRLLLLLLLLPMVKVSRIEDIEGQHGRIGIASRAFMGS